MKQIFYPFGMLMPGRYQSDSSNHCITISRSDWSTEIVDTCRPIVELTGIAVAGTANFIRRTTYLELFADKPDDQILITATVEPGKENTLYLDILSLKDNEEKAVNVKVVEFVNGEAVVVGGGELRGLGQQRINFNSTGSQVQLQLSGPYNLQIGMFCTQYTRTTQTNYLTSVCDEVKDKYKFGFNGQEKVNEIAGVGNHNTAEFWEYDTRLGRRWNLDPEYKKFPHQSPFAVFNSNPIIFNDKKGNIGNFVVGFVMGFVTDVVCQMAVNIALNKPIRNIDLFDAFVSGGVGALTSGFSTQATLAKATAKIASATGLSGKVISRTFSITAVVSEEGIQAAVDINLGTETGDGLAVRSVFGARNAGTNGVNDDGNKKSLLDFGVDLTAGTTLSTLKGGISKTVSSIVNKKLSKAQSLVLRDLTRSMLGSSRRQRLQLNYSELGSEIKMNKTVTDLSTDLLIEPIKGKIEDTGKEFMNTKEVVPSESREIYNYDRK